MTYTHLTTDELVIIASYFKIGAPRLPQLHATYSVQNKRFTRCITF